VTQGLQGKNLEKIIRRSSLGCLASVTDVAKATIFLISENSSSITGTTLTIDAGSTA